MNIREHIEAGHYPTDEKGRALVPMRNGQTATIAATDFGNRTFPIIGWPNGTDHMQQWQAGGRNSLCGESPRDLVPPPPRKVKVTRWVALFADGPAGSIAWTSAEAAMRPPLPEGQIGCVELSGEYEEPWS